MEHSIDNNYANNLSKTVPVVVAVQCVTSDVLHRTHQINGDTKLTSKLLILVFGTYVFRCHVFLTHTYLDRRPRLASNTHARSLYKAKNLFFQSTFEML